MHYRSAQSTKFSSLASRAVLITKEPWLVAPWVMIYDTGDAWTCCSQSRGHHQDSKTRGSFSLGGLSFTSSNLSWPHLPPPATGSFHLLRCCTLPYAQKCDRWHQKAQTAFLPSWLPRSWPGRFGPGLLFKFVDYSAIHHRVVKASAGGPNHIPEARCKDLTSCNPLHDVKSSALKIWIVLEPKDILPLEVWPVCWGRNLTLIFRESENCVRDPFADCEFDADHLYLLHKQQPTWAQYGMPRARPLAHLDVCMIMYLSMRRNNAQTETLLLGVNLQFARLLGTKISLQSSENKAQAIYTAASLVSVKARLSHQLQGFPRNHDSVQSPSAPFESAQSLPWLDPWHASSALSLARLPY